MSGFKRQLDRDIYATFLNLHEFGERGELAGHERVPMVVETLVLDMPPGSDERLAVSYEGVTVHVKSEDVPEDFLTMRETSFRHERWFVLRSGCENGLKSVDLYRERT